MKLLIFSFPRTRSSLLQDSLSKYYNIKDLWEPYGHHYNVVKGIKVTSDDLWARHPDMIRKITDSIANEPNFVAKLFPNFGFNLYKVLYNKDIVWEKNDILDLSYFNIDMYDTIYCTSRKNYTDMICSYRFMKNFRKPLYHVGNKNDLKSKEIFGRQKIIIPYDDRTAYLDCIEKVVYDLRMKQFKKLQYKLIELDYDEIPKYIENNLSNVQSKYIETEFDYKQRVRNYSEIDDKIQKTFEQLEPIKKELEPLFS